MAAMIHTLIGLFSGREERGKVFGILGSANGLAGVISGLTAGPIADRWGYSALFVVATLLYLLLPIIAALMADKIIARAAKSAEKVVEQKLLSNRAYLLLFSASTLAFIASGAALLGRPLQMNRLGFDSTAITSAVAVGNLFSLPLPFLIGWFSDRIPRKYLLAACYLATMLGMATLAVASEVWHFWLCAMFMNIAAISLTVGAALVTDFVPTRLLSRGMSSFTSTNWIGITIGFVATGAALDRLGVPLVMMIGAVLAVVAFALVSSLRTPTAHWETILTTADE
ncbi:MAG: MFS transporter [Burkholderiales bacterium]|nr:MFS transporter [Anaerolineae bacterium]